MLQTAQRAPQVRISNWTHKKTWKAASKNNPNISRAPAAQKRKRTNTITPTGLATTSRRPSKRQASASNMGASSNEPSSCIEGK